MSLPKELSLSVIASPYANVAGEDLQLITLQNGEISIAISNLGCTITSINTADKNGQLKNIVAGFPDLLQYKQNRDYFGCIVGRYANRIAGGQFSIDGNLYQLSLNDGPNHLHGGVKGFHQKIWTLSSFIREHNEVGVVFEYLSPDGEEGYPGNLQVKVKYLLNTKNQLSIHYRARTDKPTPVNLTNHTYFNLTGFNSPNVLDHILSINAQNYTPKVNGNTPSGSIETVENTPMDFLQPKTIGQHINQLIDDNGYDHNFVLTKQFPGQLVLAARLSEETTGRSVRVFTDQPAIQVYTANQWDGTITGEQGLAYNCHGGIALETQAFPDSPNQAHFPDTILNPANSYLSTTIYEFNSNEAG